MANITNEEREKRRLAKLAESGQSNLSTSKSSKSIPSNNVTQIYSLYTNQFANLDVNNLKFWLESSRKGLNFWKSLLFEYIRRVDLRISAVCQTRKIAVLGRSYNIDCEDEVIREFTHECLEKIDNIANFFTDIIETSIQGLSVFEINYSVMDNMICIQSVKRVQNHLIGYDDLNNSYVVFDAMKMSATNLRISTAGNSQDRVNLKVIPQLDIPDEKLLTVESFDGDNPNGFLNGCIDSLILAYFFKSYGIKDWHVFLEKFATPMVIGKYTALNQHDKNSLFSAIQNLKNNASAVIPKDCDVEFRGDDNKGDGSQMYHSNIDFWNTEISIRVLGQNLTTEGGSTGSYAQAKVHDTVRQDVATADLMLIENTMNKLIQKIVDMNFNDVKEYPKFCFDDVKTAEAQKTEAETQKIKGETVKELKEAGFTFKDSEKLNEYMGIELVPIEVVEPVETDKLIEPTLEDINPETNLPYTQEELDKLKIKPTEE